MVALRTYYALLTLVSMVLVAIAHIVGLPSLFISSIEWCLSPSSPSCPSFMRFV
eukprot:c22783_g3_i1 orf=369-530(+)